MAILLTAMMFVTPTADLPSPEAVAWLDATHQIVMVDGEYVQNTLDLWAYQGLNQWEHAHVWHNEDGRDGRFRGGLQIYPGTWNNMECQEFAPSPELATINDQIACGRRIAEAAGFTQWPLSSRRVGLT